MDFGNSNPSKMIINERHPIKKCDRDDFVNDHDYQIFLKNSVYASYSICPDF